MISPEDIGNYKRRKKVRQTLSLGAVVPRPQLGLGIVVEIDGFVKVLRNLLQKIL
jgi:hypothetical protein